MAQQGLQEKILQRYVEKLDTTAAQIAERSGTPLGLRNPSNRQKAEFWLYRARPESPEQLMLQGVPPADAVQAVFPLRLTLIGKGSHADRVEKAEALAKLAARYVAGQQLEEDTAEEATE